MSENELKQCPFCGGVAKLYGSSKITGTGFKHYQIVVCLNDDCGCRTGFCETVADAIEKWNTRKPIEKIVEQLEEWTFNADVNLGDSTVKNSDLIASENAIEIVKRGGVDNE